MGEPLRVQCHPVSLTHDVRLLLNDREQAFPGEVDGHTLGLVHDDPYLLQRIDHLDAVAVAVLVEPVLVDRVGHVDRGLRVTPPPHEYVGVLDPPEIGVVADAGDQEDVAGAVVGVEIAAVVEVPVRGVRPGDRQRRLVDGIFVERSEHGGYASSMSRRSSPAW